MIARLLVGAFTIVLLTAAPGQAQVPQPFPKPAEARPASPPPKRPAAPPPSTVRTPAEQTAPVQQASPPPGPVAQHGEPTEAMLGAPIYPGAEFLMSFDAGRNQRYYLFGTNASFADIVNYYRTVLKQKGELVYEAPAIHEFDIGRYREETMAFPPSVTVKDYAWGGSAGYLNPKRGAQPARFKTIIQIVPAVPEQ